MAFIEYLPLPQPLFSPLTADPWGTSAELIAGPLGLALFIPLVPLLRLSARTRPREAIIAFGALWALLTAGPLSAAMLLLFILSGIGWVRGIAHIRAASRVSPRIAITLIWIGLSVLIAPLWWQAQWNWYGWWWIDVPALGDSPLRTQVLHNLGFAYLYVRMIAWGVDSVRDAGSREPPLRELLAWLLYAPCQRLGPVLLLPQFGARLATWNPRAAAPWRAIAGRFAYAALGGAAIFVLEPNTPHVPPGSPDFFSHPELYATDKLIRLVVHVPILIYLILWTYNELAAAIALWVGIPVDDNFNWLPTATSIRDFWRRWHITLGAWLRDYIYIPLGGNRGSIFLNSLVVFAFCAVWHGPSVSFLVWGLAQAFALQLQRTWDQWHERHEQRFRPRGRAWTSFCRIATLTFATLTIFAFADFKHFGVRVFAELGRRLFASAAEAG